MEDKSLVSAPIGPLIKHIAIPASVGFFFNTMFNVVDTFWGGKLGTESLAAMSASFPVFFIIIALASGISSASSALIANALGQKNEQHAKEYYLVSVLLGIVISIVLTIIGLLAAKLLFQTLGISGSTLTFALDYTYVIFYGTAFFILAGILNSYLTAIGDSKTYRNALIASCILNIVLDPWFMYGGFGVPALGLKGIALATILLQLMQCIYIGMKVRKQQILQGFRELAFNFKIVKEIITQSIPASLSMTTVAIGSFIITYFIAKYGDAAVAAYGTAVRIEQIVLLPTIGLNIAVLALIGQNNGAKRFDRVREIMRTSMKYGSYMAILALVLIIAEGRLMMKIFSDDPEVVRIGSVYLYFAAFIFLAYVILFCYGSALQGLKKPGMSLVISIARQIILPLAAFYPIVFIFELPITYVWASILVITWIAALFIYMAFKKKLAQEEDKA
ncbi:MAG TPA: MATE family efflux transporter [Candidatus Paceibacterota bacterium]|nr:MATE family efflux transporter [Candidatus Paceibacterota bacterium]